ncbi:hypothetical protein OH77DRAFT_1016634 [Trametes cingulata]|nr:hypothetical protein OH77DRAFT_1016634 [Trametes cingulata]
MICFRVSLTHPGPVDLTRPLCHGGFPRTVPIGVRCMRWTIRGVPPTLMLWPSLCADERMPFRSYFSFCSVPPRISTRPSGVLSDVVHGLRLDLLRPSLHRRFEFVSRCYLMTFPCIEITRTPHLIHTQNKVWRTPLCTGGEITAIGAPTCPIATVPCRKAPMARSTQARPLQTRPAYSRSDSETVLSNTVLDSPRVAPPSAQWHGQARVLGTRCRPKTGRAAPCRAPLLPVRGGCTCRAGAVPNDAQLADIVVRPGRRASEWHSALASTSLWDAETARAPRRARIWSRFCSWIQIRARRSLDPS